MLLKLYPDERLSMPLFLSRKIKNAMVSAVNKFDSSGKKKSFSR